MESLQTLSPSPNHLQENHLEQRVIEETVNHFSVFTAISKSTDFPANGGLRIFPYPSKVAARQSCQRLADVMNLKHQLYGTHFSGAKIVACVDPRLLGKKEKEELFQSIANVLNGLQGAVYTGCDVNTTKEDMEDLVRLTPYVLSSLHSNVDGSVATAYGVLGSLSALLKGNLTNKHVLIVGTGKVGATLAALLCDAGCQVDCLDVISSKAEIVGCRNVSSMEYPFLEPYDAIALCSAKDPISWEVAHQLQTPFLLGSTNELFEDQVVNTLLASRGILCLPSVISSAGAVICDSVEMYNAALFYQVSENLLYRFVKEQTFQKTTDILKSLFLQKETPVASELFETLPAFFPPVSFCSGVFFSTWLEKQNSL